MHREILLDDVRQGEQQEREDAQRKNKAQQRQQHGNQGSFAFGKAGLA